MPIWHVLVMDVELALLPLAHDVGELQIEVPSIGLHLEAGSSVDGQSFVGLDGLCLQVEDPLPQPPMGTSPQEALTQRHETRNVQDAIGVQVMKLQVVGQEKRPHEVVQGQRQALVDEWGMQHLFFLNWGGHQLIHRCPPIVQIPHRD